MSIEVEQRGGPRLPGGRWVGAALAAAALVAIGIITLGGGAVSGGPGTTVASFSDEALDQQLPGFVGSIHVAITIDRVPTYVVWRTGGQGPDLQQLDTSNMRFNADLSQLAGIDFLDERTGNVRVGPPESIRAISPDVSAFAWHDSEPTRLVTSRVLDATSMWLAEVPLGRTYVITLGSALEDDSEVVAFGDWGIAVHGTPDADGNLTTILFDEAGSERLRLPGVVVGSRPGRDGGVMVADRRSGDVSVTWQAGATDDALYGVGALLAVVWNPDFTAQAELRDGPEPGIDLLHVPLSDGEVRIYENLEPLAWDRSGRFLAAADGRQLVVVDTEDGEVHELGIPRGVISDVRFDD